MAASVHAKGSHYQQLPPTEDCRRNRLGRAQVARNLGLRRELDRQTFTATGHRRGGLPVTLIFARAGSRDPTPPGEHLN